jgi:ferritin-like protein
VTTRRGALGLGIAAGAAVLVRGPAARADDAAILRALIRLERTAAAAWEQVRPGLAAQERQHADQLVSALRAQGAESARATTAGRPPGSLRALLGLEERMVGAYYGALLALEDANSVQLVAGIMANHGQHLVVLRQALGGEAVPNAVERGERAHALT